MPTAASSRFSSLCGAAVSLALHAAVLGVLLLLHFPVPVFAPADPVSSRWSPTDETAVTVEPAIELAGPAADPGRPSFTAALASQPSDRLDEAFVNVGTPVMAVSSRTAPAERPAREKSSAGTGTGAGQGAGGGRPFFDVPGPGESIVFIVDSSRSMNHRHDSEFKTRFRRVKAELMKCIALMPADGKFTVIFFSRDVFPMPAPGLRTADPITKEAALRWIGGMVSDGSPTDPRKAVQLGLRLQPDRIYFLTDGEFARAASLMLAKLRQERTIVDTFAIGERLGEDVLRQFAEHNRGRYTFVP